MNFLGLHNLISPLNSSKKPKRVGRGESSGHGKTSGRGHKGQKARKSGNVRIGFEGGQNPFMRRIPKRGFSNEPFRTKYHLINISDLERCFNNVTEISITDMVSVGLIPNTYCQVKLLGMGSICWSSNVEIHAISKGAREKIEAAGGNVKICAASFRVIKEKKSKKSK